MMKVEQDALKNHRSLTTDNILSLRNAYLANGTSEAPPDNKTSIDLTHVTNDNHKRMFCKRIHSQMISQNVFGCLDQVTINKLMTMKKSSRGNIGMETIYMMVLRWNFL